jgi:hypothetical protein
MYDTLHLYLERERAGGLDLLALIPQRLGGLVESQRDGRYFVTGSIRNLRVAVGYRGISVKGSLPKYHLGDNMQTLTRQTTQMGIQMLSDELSLPMRLSKPSRIDFGQNFIMQYPPWAYFPYLGVSRYFERYMAQESLNYKSGNKFGIFYDKISESKSKGYGIPEVWQDRNALRYESRYLGRIEKQLKQADITGQSLWDERFYMGMVKRYFDTYDSIQKVVTAPLDFDYVKSPKDFWNQLALQQAHSMGQPNVLALVEEMKARGCFKHPEQYSTLKRDIKQKMSGGQADISQSLIAELDHKVKALKRFYR